MREKEELVNWLKSLGNDWTDFTAPEQSRRLMISQIWQKPSAIRSILYFFLKVMQVEISNSVSVNMSL
jgi:hypothetical protein